MKMTISAFLFVAAAVLQVASSLDCYVCTEQDSNNDKCVKTVQPCLEHEDHCVSIIRWGSTPYWTLGAKKQYYVSKLCSTRATCRGIKKDLSPRCDRTGYNDWECAECCQGDRCNYYVTLGASSIKHSTMIITSAFIMTFIIWLYK